MKNYRVLTMFIFCCMGAVNISGNASELETLATEIEKGRKLLRTKEHKNGLATLQGAIPKLKALMKKTPKDAAAPYQLGQVLFYLEKDKEAIAAFDGCIALDAKDPRPHFFKGLIARYGKDLGRAEKHFQKACSLKPDNAKYWHTLGVTLSHDNKGTEAVVALQKALTLEPKNANFMYELAITLMPLGKREEAYPLLKSVIASQPERVMAYYNLGLLCQLTGQNEESLQNFLNVVKRRPDDWRAHSKLIQIFQALGKLKERDAQREALFAIRKKGKVASLNKAALYCREQFAVGTQKVFVMEEFELRGDHPIRYSFTVMDKAGAKKIRITLGSYNITNDIAKEHGQLKGKQRLFHLDGYFPNGTHETYQMFTGEPSYDAVRKMVVQVLTKKKQAISRMVPGADEAK